MRRDYRGREAECVREIVELDKVDVARADVLIASAPKPSVGTSMEVFLAFQTGKLVITVTPPNGPPPSPWLVYHSNALVHSYEAAVDVVLDYARGLA